MPKPSTTHHPTDDEDPDLSNSTSTNAALLPPANNGYLWNKNSRTNDGQSSSVPGAAAAAASNSRSDLVLTELGTSPRVEMRGGGGGGLGGDGKTQQSSICYYLREYRCQMIMLIAFIEFGILIAGVTFYFAGVLTATCDSSAARQGEGKIIEFTSNVLFLAP